MVRKPTYATDFRNHTSLGALFALTMVFVLAISCPTATAQLLKNGLFNRDVEAPPAPKTEDEIGVPIPIPGRAKGIQGHEIQFEIEAHSKTTAAAVEFLVRDFPTAGKIVSIVSLPLRRNKALVTYVADPDSGANKDGFTFAARYRGGRYSPAVRFDIDLETVRAELKVADAVDFGEVMVGSEAQREILVQNTGNGSLTTQVSLLPPWYLLEPADGQLQLAPGSTRVLKVAFRPDLTGETSYFLSLSRSKEGTAKLSGTGTDPFVVVTEQVELTLDPATKVRSGEIELMSRGERALRLSARGNARIQGSLLPQYILAPGTPTKVSVKLAPTDTAPFDGTVQFNLDNGYSKSVTVLAGVVPGQLELKIANQLASNLVNFGNVEGGRSSERGFILSNVGGTTIPLSFHIPEPFRLMNDPGSQLAPHSSVQFSIGMFPESQARGLIDTTVNILSGEQSLSVRMLANVIPPPQTNANEAPAQAPTSRFRLSSGNQPTTDTADAATAASTEVGNGTPTTEATAPSNSTADPASPSVEIGADGQKPLAELTPAGYLATSLVKREHNPALRRPEDLAMVSSGSTWVEVGWTAPPDSSLVSFDVELRGITMPELGGLPESIWFPYPHVEFSRVERLVKARIYDLQPTRGYELRVLTIDENNRVSDPSEVMNITTELPMDWTYIYLTAGVLFLTLLILGVIKVIKNRRGEIYQPQYVDL